MHECVRARVCVFASECLCACVRIRIRICLCAFSSACLHVCVSACAPARRDGKVERGHHVGLAPEGRRGLPPSPPLCAATTATAAATATEYGRVPVVEQVVKALFAVSVRGRALRRQRVVGVGEPEARVVQRGVVRAVEGEQVLIRVEAAPPAPLASRTGDDPFGSLARSPFHCRRRSGKDYLINAVW
jgi:hypothetical protein